MAKKLEHRKLHTDMQNFTMTMLREAVGSLSLEIIKMHLDSYCGKPALVRELNLLISRDPFQP